MFKNLFSRARTKTSKLMPTKGDPEQLGYDAIAEALGTLDVKGPENPTTRIHDFHQEMVVGRLNILNGQEQELASEIKRLTEERRQTQLAITAFKAAQNVLANRRIVDVVFEGDEPRPTKQVDLTVKVDATKALEDIEKTAAKLKAGSVTDLPNPLARRGEPVEATK